MTFTYGPQSQPIRFQSQQQLLVSANFFFSFPYFFSISFLGRHPYSFQVVDQDRRHPLLKIARRLFLHLFFLVYRLSIVPSMTHRMLSHLALVFSPELRTN